MTKDLAYYIRKFSPKSASNKQGLNVSVNRGVAPNKPILLLSVIELIATGRISNNQIPFNAELIATFLKLWGYLEPERKPDIGLPFYHLTSDRFWHYQMKSGFEGLLEAKVKIRTPRTIRETVEYAYLDDELWALLQDPHARSVLTQTLLNSWFRDRAEEVKPLLQVNAFAERERELRLTGGRVYKPEELGDEQEVIVRDGAFRSVITSIYDYRCVFCGLQIISSTGQNIVDGAHIKPFSQFYDDRIDNGLSLCKNHHWAFDRFWFSITDEYTILVNRSLREQSPHARLMKDFEGQMILLPEQTQYHPRQEAIAWHRGKFLAINT